MPGPCPPAPSCPVCKAPDAAPLLAVAQRQYWRCSLCEATFLDPAQRPTRAQEHAEYHLHQNQIDDQGYRHFLERLLRPLQLKLPPGACGLDYGCGPGPALAAMLTEAGHPMALYDPLFFPQPPALGAQYDFITCTEVVEHFHRPFEEFERLDQLLKPGGWLGIMTTFQTSDAAFERWHYRRDPTHVVFYRAHTFHCIAQQHGWSCEVPRANVVLLHKSPSSPGA